jgi:SsrA-binding protein
VRVEAGVVLTGTEVKSARGGHVQIAQAYADIRDGEAWLVGASISEYAQGGPLGHQTDRDRKLLLHRAEIDSLYGKVREKGLTLVPTRMYFKDGRVKVEIALARGRERADKRRVVAERDARRDTRPTGRGDTPRAAARRGTRRGGMRPHARGVRRPNPGRRGPGRAAEGRSRRPS